MDMARANFSGVSNVFGPNALNRMKDCEFHFSKNYKRKAKIMGETSFSVFEEHAKAMLYAALPVTYEKAYSDLLAFITSKPEILSLLSWLDWWNTRKVFMFRAFTSLDAQNNRLYMYVGR